MPPSAPILTRSSADHRADLLATPLGPMLAKIDPDGALLRLSFNTACHWRPEFHPGSCDPIATQLAEYFRGERREFDLPLAPRGTEFQRKVWAALRRIPFGKTISYRQLAQNIGNPAAMRAVGGANGANPIAIIIPCHRVVAADGTLGGYTGGLGFKRRLLELEGAAPHADPLFA